MPKGPLWTKEDLATLYEMRAAEYSWADIAKAVGRGEGATKQRYYYGQGAKRGQPIECDPIEPVVKIPEFDQEIERVLKPQVDKIGAEAAHWRDLVRLATDTQGAVEGLEPQKDVRKVRLPGEPPPIILYSGDWHLGHLATRYADWLHEITMLLKAPNTGMICLGDKGELLTRFYSIKAVIDQVLPPRLQAQFLISILEELISNGKLLADVSGTHDWWLEAKSSGQVVLGWLQQKYQDEVAFFYNKGLLQVELYYEDGEEKIYPNLIFHQSRYKSFLNALHGAKREYQLTYPGKVIAGAHDHEPGMELYHHYALAESVGDNIGGWNWLIKIGPFTAAPHQLRQISAFYQPTAIFCPAGVYTREGIVMMPTLRDALAYRAGLGAAQDYEEKVISELDLSDEQKEELRRSLSKRK